MGRRGPKGPWQPVDQVDTRKNSPTYGKIIPGSGWMLFDGLCYAQCTMREIASIMGVSTEKIGKALQKFKKMNFTEYCADKNQGGQARLRRKQYEIAMEGNVTMLIWLGKQILGQVDRQEVVGRDGGPIKIESADDNKLRNEIEELEKELAQYNGNPVVQGGTEQASGTADGTVKEEAGPATPAPGDPPKE